MGLGLAYFLNPNTALEGGGLFTHQSWKDAEKINDVSLNIGFRIFLRKGE